MDLWILWILNFIDFMIYGSVLAIHYYIMLLKYNLNFQQVNC